MTSSRLAWLLARRAGIFNLRRHYCVVPNVSWGFWEWESDLLIVNKNMYLTEVEIKVSLSDWKKDGLKYKFTKAAQLQNSWDMMKKFYYAAPKELALRWEEIGIADYAGVVAVEDNGYQVIKPATARKTARPLTEKEVLKLCRLGAIKAWDRKQNDH